MAKHVTLIPKDLVFPEVRVLDSSKKNEYNSVIDEFVAKTSGSYRERVKESLGHFTNVMGELAGSSPMRLVFLQTLLPETQKLITRPELDRAVELGLEISGYVDCGVGLASAVDTVKPENSRLAKKLVNQLSKKGIKLDTPKLIPFTALSPKRDSNSVYGLVWDLNDYATKDIILNRDDFGWTWKSDNGIKCAYCDRNDSQNALNEHLAYSDDDGRVVVSDSVGVARENLDAYVDQINVIYEEKMRKAQEIRDNARSKLEKL